MQNDTDVIIAGGGPVGLYLAIRLLQAGISCRVLEKREEVSRHSKALGIHPVSLDLFDRAGITEPFLKEGIKIRRGIAFRGREWLGSIRFDSCPPPHRYILALPQYRTEQILQEQLISFGSGILQREAELTRFRVDENRVIAEADHRGETVTITGKYLVGCDGKQSGVRRQAGISFEGTTWPDTYVMGDFPDDTTFGPDAAIFLHRDGLAESFPLPRQRRRWVVKTDSYRANPDSAELCEWIDHRTGEQANPSDCSMISSFGVQSLCASALRSGRILLAGDAAHVVSPIGGQGMNLGWLGAEACAEAIRDVIRQGLDPDELFGHYSKRQRQAARQAARRAELNMHLGRPEASGPAYDLLVRMMISRPFSAVTARLFTMRGLGSWPF